MYQRLIAETVARTLTHVLKRKYGIRDLRAFVENPSRGQGGRMKSFVQQAWNGLKLWERECYLVALQLPKGLKVRAWRQLPIRARVVLLNDCAAAGK